MIRSVTGTFHLHLDMFRMAPDHHQGDFVDNSAIRKMYDFFSSTPWFWELDAWTCRATARSPYRERVIGQLGIGESSRVLDVACGTGLNFDLLQERLARTGALVGLDYSPKTLRLARKKVAKRGWDNVTLVETDSAVYAPEEPFDAALCTFAIEIIPPWRETIAMMVRAVRSGGRVGFIGFKESTKRGFSTMNPVWRAMSVPFGGVELDRTVRSVLGEQCDEVLYEEVYGGFYYLLVGTKR
jgi:ubiquinone/menaquinone biosynthesis C-methylase UbiE